MVARRARLRPVRSDPWATRGPRTDAPCRPGFETRCVDRFRTWVTARPIGSFFLLAFAISWLLWTPAVVAGDLEGPAAVLFFVGVFGPATAAAFVTRATGDSVRAWLRGILIFRLPVRFYAAAIGFPIILVVVASAGFVAAGESLDFGLTGERLAALVPLFVFCVLLNGGPEEFGWRGYALPRLQERHSPVRATIVLGGLWGLWHLPLLRIEENAGHDLATLPLLAILLWTFAGFVAYSFVYTYAWNRTRSVVIAVALHAAFNTANGVLILRPEGELVGSTYVVLSIVLTGLLWLVALGLIAKTHGRLGSPGGRPSTASSGDGHSPAVRVA